MLAKTKVIMSDVQFVDQRSIKYKFELESYFSREPDLRSVLQMPREAGDQIAFLFTTAKQYKQERNL